MIGDSKTTDQGFCPMWMSDDKNCFQEFPRRFATNGWSIKDLYENIDASIAASTMTPDCVLINIGVNGYVDIDETNFKGYYQYVIDALVTAWPGVTIMCTRVWAGTTGDDTCDLYDGWIDDLIVSNANCHAGPDERVWFKPNNESYSSDTVHFTAAGHIQRSLMERQAVDGI